MYLFILSHAIFFLRCPYFIWPYEQQRVVVIIAIFMCPLSMLCSHLSSVCHFCTMSKMAREMIKELCSQANVF
jgi:hypothetical protein